mgnify:CR=1 FL=1
MKVFENRKQNKQLGLTYAVFLMNGMLALSIGSLLPFVRGQAWFYLMKNQK